MAENNKITREQFDQIVAQIEAKLFTSAKVIPVPTDCPALYAFIEAAKAIYATDCPGP